MSESLPYLRAENPEDEPAIRFQDNEGGEILGTRENTKLYTYLGRAAFNHIFLTESIIDGRTTGYFIWAITPENEMNPDFDTSLSYMFENDYPCNLNVLEVPEWDVVARTNYIGGAALQAMKNEGDLFLPEDW